MRSIMHRKEDRTCFLCMRIHQIYNTQSVLQEHHVFYGNGLRKLSEKYGLKVYLCLNHHTYDGGPEAVHRNKNMDWYLKEEAKRAFELKFPKLDFRTIFHKEYVMPDSVEKPIEEEQKEIGIQFIENDISIDW